MNKVVTIVDYGMGNLHSVANAMRHLGFSINIAENGNALTHSSHVILPGVGAFGQGMAEIRARKHDDALKRYTDAGQGPLLGICLGAQMLLSEGSEFGSTAGLGIIQGTVEAIPKSSEKVPHVGWKPNKLTESGRGQTLIEDQTWTYFVHSFHAVPSDNSQILAQAVYGDYDINSMFGCGNVFGCQFHPEKSGEKGLLLLENFMKL